MKKVFAFWPIFLFLFLTIFLFRQYIFLGKVPFPGNLLVSFYQPWKSYTWDGYGKNGPANKPIGFDSLRIFYPLRSLTIESLKKLQLPLWNPYDFAGNTQLATYQSAVFFPLTPLFLLLPQIDAWSLTVVLEPFLASLFMYFFLRGLSLSKKSSIIGALAFGFSGGVLVLSEESFMAVYSLIVLPIVLLGIYQFFRTGKLRWFSVFTAAIVCSVFSGWFQSTLYVLVLSFAWLLFLSIHQRQKRKFFLIALGFIAALLISSVHLVPNIESYLYSARGTTDAKFLFDLYLLPVWHLVTYFMPDFFGNPATYNYFDTGFYYEKITYVGVVGIFLGLVALFRLKKSAEEWFFTLSWVITVSLGLSFPTSWLLYYLHVPFLSTILPSRIFLLSAFCVCVMAAYGMESLLKISRRIPLFLVTTTSITIFIVIWVFLFLQKKFDPFGNFALISYRNAILPTVFIIATMVGSTFFLGNKQLYKQIGFFVLVALSVLSIVYFGDKYLFFSPKSFTFPPTPVITQLSNIIGDNRFWSYGNGYIDRNFSAYYHLQSIEGYDSFYIRSYGELITASKNGGKFTRDIPRADAQLTAVNNLSEIANNQPLFTLLNLLGVKYLVAKPSPQDAQFIQNNPQQPFRQIWTDGKFVIYENAKVLPRAFFVDSYRVDTSASKQLKDLFSTSVDVSKTVILDVTPHYVSIQEPLSANARITQYENEKITIQTNTNKAAILILSDNMYPGWSATIDGISSPIFTADHSLRSVIVPKGKHTVIFMYQPKSVTTGLVLAVIGLLLFGIVGFTITKTSYKK